MLNAKTLATKTFAAKTFATKTLAATLLLMMASLGPAVAQAPPGGPPASGPVEVGVVTMSPQSIPRSTELPGRVVALSTAEIRPQVDGIVRRIAFTEGGKVQAGDILYELDDARFKAAYNAAAASLKKAEASADGARITFDRQTKLAATNAVSTQTLDDARSTMLQAEADVESAKAALETAQINLDYTRIASPIDGMIGLSTVSVGSLVTANQTTALATVRQVDPIHVDLVDSSANLLRIRDEVDAGRLGRTNEDPPKVALTLENGKPYASTGTMSLADIVVSETTGTFSLRATFPNAARVLMPGMFVRATVDLGNVQNAFLVPQRAVTRDEASEAVALFVSADGRAEQRVLTTSGSSGNSWIVTAGVKEGDRLIVDGFQKISAGAAVNPVAASIGDDGVVQQAAPSTALPAATREVSK